MDAREQQAVLEDLRSSDDELRRLAVERISALPEAEAREQLLLSIGDESWRVRKAAVERLAVLGDPEATSRALVHALADGENPGRRNAALESLHRMGAGAVPTLLVASEDPDSDVRKQVVDALAGIGAPDSEARLRTMLADRDPNVRAAAADALGNVGADRSASALVRAATEDEEVLVRLSALRSLARLEASVPVRDLAEAVENPLLRAAAFAVLGESDDPESPDVLLKGMQSRSRATRCAAMEALVRMSARDLGSAGAVADHVRRCGESHPEVTEAAVQAVCEGRLAARLTAVQFAGMLRQRVAVRPMLDAAADEALTDVVAATLATQVDEVEAVLEEGLEGLSARSRAIACRLLAEGRSVESEAVLLRTLEDPDPDVRSAAALALERRARPEIVESLVACFFGAVRSRRPREWNPLAGALARAARLSSERTAGRIVSLLTHGVHEAPAEERRAVAIALGPLRGSAAEEALALLLSDAEPAVRRTVVEVAAERGTVLPGAELRLAATDESREVRAAAAAALVSTPEPGPLDELECLLHDEEGSVRAAAARSLGRLPADERVEDRLALLETAARDEAPVAMAALEALRDIGGPRAASIASGCLASSIPEVIRLAAQCIEQDGSAADLEALQALVSHADWTVRGEVIRILGERGQRGAVPALLRRLEAEPDEFVRQAMLRALDRLEGA